MVRLKRELAGVQVLHRVPVPSYALDPVSSREILPWLDAWILQREPGRTLLAGSPRADLVVALAQAGHWLTVADLDPTVIGQWHERLDPAVLGRLTLVDKAYGDAAFGPSSFDHVILLDNLHRYREPQWLLHKALRELKPDAWLAARVLVQGPLVAQWQPLVVAPTTAVRPLQQKLATTGVQYLENALQSGLAAALAPRPTREALQRGAYGGDTRFALQFSDVAEAMAAGLSLHSVALGDPLRLRACNLLAGLRFSGGAPMARLLQQTQPLVDASDARTEPRVVAVVARRSLGLHAMSLA